MASDVHRDGMALELTDLDEPKGHGPALEILRTDEDRSFTFVAHRAAKVPLEILSKFVERATRSLPPE